MNPNPANPPLRILHIILALTPTNGQYNEHCLPLRHTRDITICTYFKSQITPPAELTLFDGDNTLWGFHRTLQRALQSKEYDLIHVHTPHAGLLLLMTLLLSGLYRKLIPSTVHTVQNSYQNFKLRNKLLFIPSFLCFQHLVFCSHASYESFPAFFKWLGGKRLHVVQNAVDLERIDRNIQRVAPRASAPFTIASVGMIAIKNPFTVLNAFRQSLLDQPADQTSQLVIMGRGALLPAVAEEVARSGLQSQVTTTGMIERDQVFARFLEADVFVSASWGEGLPVAVLEAMACRRPVILSDIPPHREIAEGVDFIPLIKPDDVVGFARAITRLRALPPAERQAIGHKCRQLIEERFSLTAMHNGYKAVYGQVTDKPIVLQLELAR